jgi:MHS family proline/betaine transporter-like MFS transporter
LARIRGIENAKRKWGWRVPFLLSIAVVGLALYVHLRMEESREFVALAAARAKNGAEPSRQRSPILQVITSSWRLILLAGVPSSRATRASM